LNPARLIVRHIFHLPAPLVISELFLQRYHQRIFPLPHSSSTCFTVALNGPFFTIMVMTSYNTSAAAIVVCSALVSYAGATSTISAATKLMPSSPRRMVRSSRVDQPPVSGVPVAGATFDVISCDYSRNMWHRRLRSKGGGRRGKEEKNVQAGSNVSISILKYTGFSVLTLSLIFLMIPAMPIVSISRASEISKPQYPSFS